MGIPRSNLEPVEPGRIARRIAWTYALFGALYILTSDKILAAIVSDAAALTRVQIFKGWAFILTTAILVYFLVYRQAVVLLASRRQLEQSEQSYRRIIDTAYEGICTVDSTGNLVLVNQRLAEMLGSSADQLAGVALLDFVDLEFRHVFARRLDHRQPTSGERLDLKLCRADGGEAWVIASISPLVNGEESCPLGSLIMLTDITDRMKLELQLQQLRKMEAVGQLAGGVAHDFNNIVTAIFGHVELARHQLRRDPANRDALLADLKEIEEAGERAGALTRQLLTFSRRQLMKPEILDISTVITNMERMLRRLIREDVQLTLEHSPGLWPIRADANQIEQVVLNLMVNARDAMPEGGELSIKTANAVLDEHCAATHPEAKPGRHVVLTISDTGCGMDAATLQHIFEPFFTTKPVGKGTGLGLATVYGIVHQLEGHIGVYSEPNVGTTFRVYLPVTGEGALPPAPAPAVVGADLTGHETVLVCEDDEAVRRLVCRILEGKGYAVLQAHVPADAIDTAKKQPGTIRLLITDVILPGMNGRELANRMRTTQPDLRVLFISGYTSEVVGHHGILDAGVEFLEKPFSSDSLLRRVREVLNAELK